MARPKDRLPGNAPGEFYVDSTCIDCGACRWIAPTVFSEAPAASVVSRQPGTPEEELQAEMALVNCPTASIGAGPGRDFKKATAAFPHRFADGVYFCGFASEASYGASSWLIARPEGNVLVDSPRLATPLVRRLEGLGGVKTMFLTHRDDVADHAGFRKEFGCERVMHADDASFQVERLIEGDAPVRLAADLLAIPTPGHTQGHMVLLYQEKYLFTGDHVWGDSCGKLEASRAVCWFSWPSQRRSMRRLLDYPFEWVLPGHGDPHHAEPAAMRRALEDLITRME